MRSALSGVRNSAGRQALVVVGLGLLIAAIAFTPSLAGSFLTKSKAKKTFVTKRDANNIFETKSHAASSYAGKSAIGAAATSGSGFSSTSLGVAVPIPGGSATVNVPAGETATLAATFSGVSSCQHTPTQDGYQCDVEIKIDGANGDPAPEAGGYRFDSTESNLRAHSLTVTKQVTSGQHTVSVDYTGCNCGGTTTFDLNRWNLLVQYFPV